MILPFILKALLCGVGISFMTGPLGCFVVWQRLSYFGDMLAHAALLGVVFALFFNTDMEAGIIIVAVAATLLVLYLEQKHIAFDTLFGITANGALALALVLIALHKGTAVDVNSYLFGDILAVERGTIKWIYICAALMLLVLTYFWRELMQITVHPDVAKVEGVPVKFLRALLMLMIALVIAVSIKSVGVLLITSLLIIPAAAARYFAPNPTIMAVVATIISIVSVCGGLLASVLYDTPSGPSIILAALGIFFAAQGVKRLMA